MIWMQRVAAPLAAMIVLAGCSGSNEPEPASTVTASAEPSAEEQATAAHQRYWDVYVQLANSGDVSAAAFEGVADGSFIESDLKSLGDQADAGVVRTGEPEFSDFKTVVDGDSATSLVCFDETGWGFTKDGEPLESPGDIEPTPFTATLEERDGAWLVTDLEFTKNTPCP